MRFFVFLFVLIHPNLTYSQTIYTSQGTGGAWDNPATWDNGVPSSGSGVGMENIILIDSLDTVSISGDGTSVCNVGLEPEVALSHVIIYVKGELSIAGQIYICGVSIEDPGNLALTGSGSGMIITNGGTITETVVLADPQADININGTSIWNGDDPDVLGPQTLGSPNDPLALPIELLSFKVKKENTLFMAQWTSINEEKTSHYELEESNNGLDFQSVSIIESTKKEIANYAKEFHPISNLSPILYYRLKQVDLNGEIFYSKIVSHQNSHNEMALEFSPNPTSGNIYINNIYEEIKIINLYDILGNEFILTYRIEKGFLKADLSIFNEGHYFLQISDGLKSYTGRVLIHR